MLLKDLFENYEGLHFNADQFKISRIDANADHTIWITPTGVIYSLIGDGNTHFQFIADNFYDFFPQPKLSDKEFSTAVYDLPIESGWLRIRNTYHDFNINGQHAAAHKLFKYWFPAVKDKMKSMDSFMVFIDYVPPDGMSRNSIGFDLPQEMTKLVSWAKMATPVFESSMYSNLRPKRLKAHSSAMVKNAPTDVLVAASDDVLGMVAIALKGRTAYVTPEVALSLAKRLTDASSIATQKRIEKQISLGEV